MVQLTPEQKTELQSIIENQYAVGPFSGMVYNQVAQALRDDPTQDRVHVIDTALQIALQTKLRLKALSLQDELKRDGTSAQELSE